jgi:hypothetical protein
MKEKTKQAGAMPKAIYRLDRVPHFKKCGIRNNGK